MESRYHDLLPNLLPKAGRRGDSRGRNAVKIKVPVLLFHGALDRNVGILQSKEMKWLVFDCNLIRRENREFAETEYFHRIGQTGQKPSRFNSPPAVVLPSIA